MEGEDLQLLERWCAGDRGAGNDLFNRHFASVYRFFETKTDGDVEDLVQETFLACTTSRETFRRQSSFRTYLFAIARHVLLHHWRKRSRGRAMLDFDEVSIASLSTSAGSRLVKHEERERLLAAFQSLAVEQQLLLELFYWEDFDRGQLAEIFDVEVGTVGSRLSRARDALHEKLAAGESLSALALDALVRKAAR